MRKSHEGLTGISKDNYPGLPDELKEFNYYYDDGETGHVIMAVPECLLDEADGFDNLDGFEVPIPVKYVLSKGYRMYKNHVICEARYDLEEWAGLMVDDEWYEV